jgi:predicted hydrocarbon binding protein
MLEDVTFERGINAFLLKNWLMERFGMDGLRNVMGKISTGARAMLEDPVLNKWYPVSEVREVFETIHNLYAEDNPGILVEYGRFAAERSLKGFLRYLARLLTIEQLTKRMGAFWKQYHQGGFISAGKVEEKGDSRTITVTVSGYSMGISGCRVITGYLEGLIPMANVRDVEVKEKTCIHRGDRTCSWEVRWKK